ncbi:paeninodin family lasso peptide [Gracilibacillus oryzae]|uniref:Paeninodin family lasso peptide n=1 Tax=Gracilibacillus oryzae TaxID=1672701 RepID=A0A7C8GSW5_9BACI|nr:paeninodin family lasso peptide [Gracilibacillus oryzae]KAB8133659.1 paeninodin family lasso peptide [Gracilibacillus oryzae]
MKQEWQAPQLEVLDVKQTMLGPGMSVVDFTFSDENETIELHES